MAKNQKKKVEKLEIETWLEKYIYEQVEGEDYIDNLRWGAHGDVEEMKAYNNARSKGCCGSFDSKVTASDGLTYVVGCNYGH